MTERFAIYYAPARNSPLAERADAWLKRPALRDLGVSARRYGFHATLKAPMALSRDRAALEGALADFAASHPPVALGKLNARMLDGFLALTPIPQPEIVTRFAAEVVEAFDGFRAPLDSAERERRLKAMLTDRQVALLDRYGYPYVLDQFRFHMTLSDRLPPEAADDMVARAREWFAISLAEPIQLDRLVLFHEAEPGAAFIRLNDYLLEGAA